MQYNIYYDNICFSIIRFCKEISLFISTNHERFCCLFFLQNFLKIKIKSLHCRVGNVTLILSKPLQNYLMIV